MAPIDVGNLQQAQLKALAEESWRKAHEVARVSDERRQHARLVEWDRSLRLKSTAGYAPTGFIDPDRAGRRPLLSTDAARATAPGICSACVQV